MTSIREITGLINTEVKTGESFTHADLKIISSSDQIIFLRAMKEMKCISVVKNGERGIANLNVRLFDPQESSIKSCSNCPRITGRATGCVIYDAAKENE